MTKHKKKRRKTYTGRDAARPQPRITKLQAESRSRLGQWLHDRRQLLGLVGRGLVIIGLISLIILGIIGLF